MHGNAFVIGCPRSGTSILLELLDAHPDVKTVFEAHHVWEGIVPPGDNHRLSARHATPDVVARCKNAFTPPAGKLLIEKNPRNSLRIPFLRAIWPEAKFIHIIRDGRDVTCSLKPGIGGDEWKHAKPPGWQWMMSEMEWPERAAVYWADMIHEVSRHKGDHMLLVKYEDLLINPSASLARIERFLGLKESPETVSAAHKSVSNDTSGGVHAAAQMEHYTDDHTVRIGRYRENLTGDDLEQVEAIMGETLYRYGYM